MPEQHYPKHDDHQDDHGRPQPEPSKHGHPGPGEHHGGGHDRGRDYEIVVDGTVEVVHDATVTYEQVVAFAYPNPDPQLEFSVTYRKAAGPNTSGTLANGGSVRILKKGTTFNVTPTVKS